MKIQKAVVDWRGVRLHLARRTSVISFKNTPDTAAFGAVCAETRLLGLAWKPVAVLPADFRLKR